MSTVEFTTSREVSKILELIFKRCYPTQEWNNNNAYPDDGVILAKSTTDGIIGFVQVHDAAPYPFENITTPVAYLYNLCVLPGHRERGAGSSMLNWAQRNYPAVQLHAPLELYRPGWLEGMGFQRGNIRGRYIEYMWSRGAAPNVKKITDDEIRNLVNKPHYDYAENIIYLDPLY